MWPMTLTLAVPVLELSAFDVSNKDFVEWFCSIWNIWMKLHRYMEDLGLHFMAKDCYSSS